MIKLRICQWNISKILQERGGWFRCANTMDLAKPFTYLSVNKLIYGFIEGISIYE